MSMIVAEFATPYDGGEEVRLANQIELWERLQKEAVLVMEPAEWDSKAQYATYTTFKAIVSDEVFFSISFDPRWETNPVKFVNDGVSAQTQRIVEKQLSTPPVENVHNTKVDVHVPGFALTTYNQTMLLEDSCTDALQTALNQGWRIIAACPQPDSRRPDYILGRYEPEHTKELDKVTHSARAMRAYDLPRFESTDLPKERKPQEPLTYVQVEQTATEITNAAAAALGVPASMLVGKPSPFAEMDDEIPF